MNSDFESISSLFTDEHKRVENSALKHYLPSGIKTKAITKKSRKTNISDIWDENEIDIVEQDPRLQPGYSINYVQRVSSEEMYLGMSGRTASISHSDDLVVKIVLPNTELKDINLHITRESLEVLCPD